MGGEQGVGDDQAGTDRGPATAAARRRPRRRRRTAAKQASAITQAAATVEDPKLYKSLRDYLVADTAERFALPVDQLQFHFNPADEKLLNLCEPHFQFN